MPFSFTWNKAAQRFRYASGNRKGQFVSKKKVRSLMEDYIEQQKTVASEITDRLLSNAIGLQDWETQFAEHIKKIHSVAYLLGKGGSLRYDNAIDKGRIGNIVRSEYMYLRGFTEAIASGRFSKKEIRARAMLYINSAYGTQQRAEEYGHIDEDYAWEENVRSPLESCADCVGFSKLGIVPIGTIPPIGQGRICKVNCRCYKKFYRDKKEAEQKSTKIFSSWGWIGRA